MLEVSGTYAKGTRTCAKQVLRTLCQHLAKLTFDNDLIPKGAKNSDSSRR